MKPSCNVSGRPLAKTVFIEVTRYAPAFSAFIFVLHYVHGFFGIRLPWTDFLVDVSLVPYVFTITASYIFGFCRLHRLFITYTYLCSLDISLHRWGHYLFKGFHDEIFPIIFVVSGIYLFARLAQNRVVYMKQKRLAS